MIKTSHFVWTASALLGAAGIVLLIMPAPITNLAPFAAPAPSAPVNTTLPSSLDRLASRFDLSDLPPPVVATAPPPDPTASIKRFRYTGAVSTDSQRIALFEVDGVVRSLRQGDALGEFILVDFNLERATFSKNTLYVDLPLSQ